MRDYTPNREEELRGQDERRDSNNSQYTATSNAPQDIQYQDTSWMNGIMTAVEILTQCNDKRPTYDQLEAAYTLEAFSHGAPSEAAFPSRAVLGEAAELLSVSGVGDWDHLVDDGTASKSSTVGDHVRAVLGEPVEEAKEEHQEHNKMPDWEGSQFQAARFENQYAAARLEKVLLENQMLREKLRAWKAFMQR